MELRDYQVTGLQTINQRIGAGVQRIILQLATGGGKTIVAVALILIAAQQNQRILFVAHRVELIDQAYDKLIAWGVPPSVIGVIRSGDPRAKPGAPIQVASVQSLRSLPPANIIFIDEAHRSAAVTYKKIFEGYPGAIFFGLTATPERLDGKPLDMFQEIIVLAQPHELALQGFIAAPIIFGVPEELMPELEDIKPDSSKKQIAIAMKKRKLIGSIPDHWVQRAEERTTVAFCADIEHSKGVCQAFLDRGIRAVHADGNMSDGERKKLIARVRSGEVQVVTQVDLWVEGVDLPEVKCAILARPTYSLTIFLQSIGRIVRPHNGIIPLVLDHAGNTLLHGMPLEPRVYSLTGRVRRLRGAQITTQCKQCFNMFAADAKACPHCGWRSQETAGEGAPRVIRTADGTLVEMPYDEATIRQVFWKRKIKEASQIGFKLGWCKNEFKERFGVWPPLSWCVPDPLPPREASDEEKRKELRKLQGIAYKLNKNAQWIEERYHTMFNDTPRALLEREVETRAKPATTVQTSSEERVKMEI